MKKIRGKLIGTVIALSMILVSSTNNVFAGSLLTPNNSVRIEDVTVEPRSRYLATAISEITNEGLGVLGIYADFTSYSDVQWARITINLERSKSLSGSWSSVKTYVKEFTPDDTADGRLHSGRIEFSVDGFATDYYYRLTCEHKVKTPSGTYETKTTRTDGVLLTDYPVYRIIDETK